MFETRNTGTGNGMRGTRRMGKCYIQGNVAKHSRKCHQTFQAMLNKIPRNAAKNSVECPKTFQGMLPNTPGNVVKHSRESC